MPTRAAVAATATGLAVLVLLAGARWTIDRNATPPARWVGTEVAAAPPTPATSPTPSVSAAPQPAATSAAAPASSAPGSPTNTPTRGTPPTKAPTEPTDAPLDLKRMTGTKAVALTFDDGPHPVWTPKILDQLRAAKVPATFCLVGSQADRHPALVARIVREGHTLCNHTWHHEFDLGTRPEAEIRANLERTNRAIQRAVPGAEIKYFRHPGGKWTQPAVKVARDLGMISLHWDVDPQDWAQPGAEVVSKRVIDKARPGSIVLLHDGGGDRGDTLQACPSILSTLKRKFGIVLLK